MKVSNAWILVVVLVAQFVIWGLANRPEEAAPYAGRLRGLSYSPFHGDAAPDDGDGPSRGDLVRDVARLQGLTGRLRTYGSKGAEGQVAAAAAERGVAVMQGAWISRDARANHEQIDGAVALANGYANVTHVLVGNEAVLRTDVTPATLAAYLDDVRARVHVPVSSAEPWHVWLQHPELADHVDFLAVHVLPYWEGVPVERALAHLESRLLNLRARFPGKPIVLTEVGWPSEGPAFDAAVPGRVAQARFLRGFLGLAEARGIDYVIMEAFDQPWKHDLEGRVGAHWGVLDAGGTPKFALLGAVVEHPDWPLWALLSALLGLVPVAFFLARSGRLSWRGRLLFAATLQGLAAMAVWTVTETHDLARGVGGTSAWLVLLGVEALLLLGVAADAFELVEVLYTRTFRRLVTPGAFQPGTRAPRVSIHLPIHAEPPDLVIRTLDALTRLDYPDYEVLVIDNNTHDESLWRPVEAWCAKVPRVRFFHVDPLAGFKAGALNFALAHTDPAAEVVGVIDADYVVHPDWLKDLVPHFADASVAVVQAPQDNRQWRGDAFRTMCTWEYAGFFHLGMVQRNERNAIIQHGTMTLVRRSALVQVGAWSEWCITEDAELGLKLMEQGWQTLYTERSYGWGVPPDTFQGYKKQRFRWAYGSVQIVKAHWKALTTRGHGLDLAQRLHFVAGWLPWLNDGLLVLFTVLALGWTLALAVANGRIAFPSPAFVLPIVAVFVLRAARSVWLYARRVPCGLGERLGAALAGMSLTYSVGRAVWHGIRTRGFPFVRTPKAEDKPAFLRGLLMARDEAFLSVALWLGAVLTLAVPGRDPRGASLWALALVVQSVPYLASVAMSFVNVLPAVLQSWERRRATLRPLAGLPTAVGETVASRRS